MVEAFKLSMSPFFHRVGFSLNWFYLCWPSGTLYVGDVMVIDSRLDLKFFYQAWSVGEEKVKYANCSEQIRPWRTVLDIGI